MDTIPTLARLVTEYDVTYRVWPLQAVRREQLLTTGFEVELTGKHVNPEHPPEPGCDECVDVHRRLLRIAEAALPAERPVTLARIRGYEPNLVQLSAAGPALVRLTIEIIHRDDPNGEVDAEERACLDDLVANLRALGVRRP